MTGRVICWFSCGAASAVATKLTLSNRSGDDEVVVAYCETGSEHEDNARFLTDCEEWFGQKVVRLRSEEYSDTWAVWEKRKYIAGISGAPCTMELKIKPRLHFQRVDDLHVFGYTADAEDVAPDRLGFGEHWFEEQTVFPLIERGLNKAACIEMVQRAGIAPPVTYALGFPNANCLPCPKATSPAYWALVRLHFPDRFDRMASLSRELGARLTRISDERIFIDEIPANFPTTGAIVPSCDFLCAIAEKDM
jgi:3'-phosphoadenosine 5'-phosphosulfate sulfotransferase (PAPS reductase)/FAD synthetase